MGIAVLAALHAASADATAQSLSTTTVQTEQQKPDLSLSNQPEQSTTSPFVVTLTPMGDPRCCVAPGRDDVGVSSPHSLNSPTVFGAGVKVGGQSAAFSIGAVGSQTLKLPLFMSTTLTGAQLPIPDASFFSDMSRSGTSWQIVASAHKNLFTSKAGRTIGVSGDVFLPVGVQSLDGIPANPLIPSRAVRFGLTVGF